MQGVVAETLTVLRRELPAKEYESHEQRLSESDEMILERYRIKPLYILMILSLHKIGFSWITSTIIPSLICFFLIGLSIWQFAYKNLPPLHCFLMSLLSVCILPTLVLARLSTPDAISCFVLLNAFIFSYSGRNKNLWLSLLMLAIIVRLDNIVTELLFLVALYKWPVNAFANKAECCLAFKVFDPPCGNCFTGQFGLYPSFFLVYGSPFFIATWTILERPFALFFRNSGVFFSCT